MIELEEIKNSKEESSSGFVQDISLESLSSLSVPALSLGTSFYSSAKKACNYLVKNTWKAVFSKDIESSNTTKEIHKDWAELKSLSPKLDSMAKELSQIYSELENLSSNGVNQEDQKVIELNKQAIRIAKEKSSLLQSSFSKTSEILTKQISYIDEVKADLKLKGIDSKEIDLKVDHIQKTANTIRQTRKEIIANFKSLKETFTKFEEKTIETIDFSLKEQTSKLDQRNLKISNKVLKLGNQVKLNCHNGCCEIKAKIEQIEEIQNLDSSEKVFNEIISDFNNLIENQETQTRNFIDAKNYELSSNNISVENEGDKYLIDSLASFKDSILNQFNQINEDFRVYFKLEEDFISQSASLIRMTNVIYFGANAESIMSLGMFSGNYALSILSFIEDLQKLEELKKKSGFLNPEMTLEEKLELSRLI